MEKSKGVFAMGAVGVVAEYNPFHAGHAAHLARIRELRPDAAIVIALSGDFVQRGEAAVFSKFARAEAAVADLLCSSKQGRF